MRKRQFVKLAAATVASAALPSYGQTWPSKPIRIIVGYSPGGPVDTLARLLLPGLTKALGQPVIVDNKPGAAGAISVTSTLQAEPDGYTFGLGVLGVLAILPHLQKTAFSTEGVNYVTLLTKSPHVFAVTNEGNIKTLGDLVAAAKKQPGKMNYGSPGTGSSTHLDGEMLEQEAGIDAVHVPYKGGPPAMNALMGGEIQMISTEISVVLSQQDRLRVVAVLDDRRSPQLPNVPTAVEQGFPALVSHSVYGIIAPNRTPVEIVERFRTATIAALMSPEVRDKLISQGQTPIPSSPAEYRDYMVSESRKWGDLIRKRNLRIE